MSWSYSADPTSSPKDAVRFLIGDTNPTTPLVQDEEIAFSLGEVNNEPYRAASNTCFSLASQFIQLAETETKTVGGLSLSKSYGDRAEKFKALAAELLMRSRRVNPPHANADPNALGAELRTGKFDRYYAVANDWPSGAVTGVTSTYGTGYEPGYDDDVNDSVEPF